MNKLKMFWDNLMSSWSVTDRLRHAKKLSENCTKYSGPCPMLKMGMFKCSFKNNDTCKISVTAWYRQLKKMGM